MLHRCRWVGCLFLLQCINPRSVHDMSWRCLDAQKACNNAPFNSGWAQRGVGFRVVSRLDQFVLMGWVSDRQMRLVGG